MNANLHKEFPFPLKSTFLFTVVL